MTTSATAAASGRIAWTWVLLSSLAVAAFAVAPYLTANLRELADSSSGSVAGNYVNAAPAIRIAFYTHIGGGGCALILGPLQFWRGLRTRWPAVHSWTGKAYLTAVGAGGLAGLVIAPCTDAGLIGTLGFGVLALLWLTTGALGYRAIRRGDVAAHRAAMTRNFALTYAGVTLRLWLLLLTASQVPFGTAYLIVPFLCWVPNLVVAEWLIVRRGLPR